MSDTRSGQHDALARLDDLFAEALRMAAGPRHKAQATNSAMTIALAEACQMARAHGLQPERVIIMLKSTWARLSDARFATRDEARDALDHAVSACIEQYFAENRPSAVESGARQ